MKVMVVYDSYFGNTKKVAEAMEKGLAEQGILRHLSIWSMIHV